MCLGGECGTENDYFSRRFRSSSPGVWLWLSKRLGNQLLFFVLGFLFCFIQSTLLKHLQISQTFLLFYFIFYLYFEWIQIVYFLFSFSFFVLMIAVEFKIPRSPEAVEKSKLVFWRIIHFFSILSHLFCSSYPNTQNLSTSVMSAWYLLILQVCGLYLVIFQV